MQKKFIIPISIVIALIIGLIIIFFSLTSSSMVKAQLIYEKGDVFVNNQKIQGDTTLKQKDSISTSSTGSATIILSESVMIFLEPNTEITLEQLSKTHPKVSQSKGETWNKFTKLFGVTQYTISSGNSVASVRGTSFTLTEGKIIVDEGEVEFTIDGQTFTVINQVIEKIGEEINQRDLNPEEKQQTKQKIERLIQALKQLREAELNKNARLISFVRDKYEITDQDIKTLFEEADSGQTNLRELKEQSPINVESLEKIIEITDKIIELKQQASTI